MNSSFEKLAQRSGGYSLPFLVKLQDYGQNKTLYFINDTKDLIYNGVTYKASSFQYKPNNFVHGLNGGGSLEISAVDAEGTGNEALTLVRTYKEFTLEVVGVLMDSNVTELNKYKHHYGTIEVKNMLITFTFDRDDRLDMTFPALIWNNSNNRGNA